MVWLCGSGVCVFLWNTAAVVCILYLLKLLVSKCWELCSVFRAFFLAPWGISRTNLRKYGQWAVVTGGCDGIGRGYALELARQGLNVVILSNVKERLQKVADEIREKYGRDVRIMCVDFTAGQETFPEIAKELQELDIGVLVNNVGSWGRGPDYFADIPETQLRNMVELNCHTILQMTRLVLPKMLERKRGAIVNVSSIIIESLFPLLSVYAGSKMFIYYFSEALRLEYGSRGITVQVVKPYGVSTGLTGYTKSTIWIPNGEKFARAAVATIGIQETTYGYLSHVVMSYVLWALPRRLIEYGAWKDMLDMIERRESKEKKQ